MANKQIWTATGRRKRSVAQVKLVGGTGNITVNGVNVDEYMPYATLVMDLKQPLVLLIMKIDLILILKLMVAVFQVKLEQLDLQLQELY